MDTSESAAGTTETAPRAGLATTTTKPSLDISSLTTRQRRGTHCAYCHCDLPLRSDHVVDLGQRRDSADRTRVFPRAHPECIWPTRSL